MESALMDFIINVLAALAGAAGTYAMVWLKQTVRQRTLDRAVRLFFGVPGHVVIIHSAVRDNTEEGPVYSYPATDTRAAQKLVRLFESVGLSEGRDFSTRPDRPDRQLPVDGLSEYNIVLLCGPARNGLFAKVAAILPMRYCMTVDDDGRNVLVDQRREQRLLSSRQAGVHSGQSIDYGLVASLPSPYNLGKRLVILAGIHGTGTVGAAEFVADLHNLRVLNGRRQNETVSEVVRVDYHSADIETPTRVELA